MAGPSALLQDVVSAPADVAPRLAYAKAVARRDPERAEFIRIQLALARWRKEFDRCLDPSLERELTLVRARGREWAADIAPLVDGWQFLSGFVEVVTLDAAAFLADAEEIYRRAPVLHLNLTGVRPVAERLFASPSLGRIRSLRLHALELGDAEAALLASSPHLGRLEWLDLGGNRIGAAGLEALAGSAGLPRLGYVDLSYNAVDDPTPRHADEYDADSAAALRLQAAHGPRAWLDARTRSIWPPHRDAVEYPRGWNSG
ncbi:TIGR02996 domain-containing protein [Streptacidiphilus sp. N1-3]|uniref:TIGR02996 domain-containing protein n=1 Tax=Streptacidiphilus alkalitolerans TaxID=3342712 RepID=A0ABV6XE63_9ACTN